MKLQELIDKVDERTLSKEDLEMYRDQMSKLFAQLQLETAEVEKQKALFFEDLKQKDPTLSDVSIKRKWQATSKGLREIELKRYSLALKEMLNSLKSRVYSIY